MGSLIVSPRLSSDVRDVEDFGVLIASVVAALRISSLVAALGGYVYAVCLRVLIVLLWPQGSMILVSCCCITVDEFMASKRN